MEGCIAITWDPAWTLTTSAAAIRDGDVAVLGDARLDDEACLAAKLGGTGARGLALIALAYRRWGRSFAEHLVGDYAAVVVDPASRTVLAARDPFGVRRLAYRRIPNGIALATDVGALSALGTPSAEIDESTVWALLTGAPSAHGQTFFRTVSYVPPGHTLVARPSSVDVRRHFFPPTVTRRCSRQETLEAFRSQFEVSVRDRLRSERPLIVDVSGGLDSGAIACVASSMRNGADLHYFNGRFRDADEQRYVRAIDAHVHRRVRVAECDPTSALDEPIDPGNPIGYPLFAMTRAMWALAAETGARALLSGVGGDELLFERGVYRDLAAGGKWAALWRETALAPHYSARTRGFYLRDAVRSLVPRPHERVRAVARRLRRAPRRPDWLRMAAPPDPPVDTALTWDWESETQRFTWDWLTSPRLTATLEALDRLGASAGIEMRYPFLDSRLAELVLATPYAHRLPGGRMKVLLRDGLAGVLPEAIRERQYVTTYDRAVVAAMVKKLPALREVFARGPWRSAPWVDRSRAASLLDSITAEPLDVHGAIVAWKVATLELWLRAIA